MVGVLDRQHAGETVQDVLGFGGGIPVVGSMREGLALGPTAVLIGIAPQGGRLPEEWRGVAGRGARRRLRPLERAAHVPRRRSAAGRARPGRRGRTILDLRRPPADLPVASGLGQGGRGARRAHRGHRLQRRQDDRAAAAGPRAQRAGLRTRFVATGQTGIMIEGWGIAVDAVVADFIAGAAERLVLEGSQDADVVLVEGQGSINHPGYSGVTLGLLHGSCPDALILCHQAAGSTSATTARPPGSGSRRSPTTSGCTRASARRCTRPGSSGSRSTPTT